MKIIESRLLSKEYKNKNRRVVALKETTLSFDSTGLVFLLGESGAGKSTLLNLLSLQEKPTSGDLIIEGNDVSSLSGDEKSSIKNEDFAILFQNLNLLEEFSVYDNLKLAREIQGKDLSKEEAIGMLKRFSLPEDIIDEMPFSLSGGQRQRVALARALVKDFKVLFCDEPTASLDDDNASIVAKCLKDIAKDHLVIAATHDTGIANSFGDRIITIKEGEIFSDVTKNAPPEISQESTKKDKTHRHLPAKTLLKLSMHGVRTSIPRFVFALISTFLTLSVFMTSMSFYLYDEIATTYACLKKEGVSYIEVLGDETIDEHHSNTVYLPYEKKEELNKYFDTSLGFAVSNNSGVFEKARIEKPEKTLKSEKALFFSESNIGDFGFKVIGEMPKHNPSGLEVALTAYDCYLLGYTEETSCDDRSVYEEIIKTKTLEVAFPKEGSDAKEKVQARVTAVVDTGFKTYESDDKKELAEYIRSYEITNEPHYGICFDEETYQEIANYNNSITRIYAPLSARPLEKVAKHNSEERIYAFELRCHSRFDKPLELVRNTQRTYSEMFLAISMFLLLVAGLAYVSFIIASVSSLRPSVMILQTLGVSKASATSIYALEALFLGLICGLLSLIPYFIGVEWFGSYMAKETLISVSPFSFNLGVGILSILGLCFLAVVVAGLVSIFSKAKRK